MAVGAPFLASRAASAGGGLSDPMDPCQPTFHEPARARFQGGGTGATVQPNGQRHP